MPLFNYTAIDPHGRQFSDTQLADSVVALESVLQAQGAWLVKARAAKAGATSSNSKKAHAKTKVARWDLINLYTQLSLLLNAGVTLAQGLGKLAVDLEGSKLGPVVRALAYEVESGTPLPQALAQFPRTFSNQAIALVEAGEASGKLPESFTKLSANLEWTDGLISTARQALVYPMLISSAAVGLVVLLFTFVVPRFQEIFDQINTPLPQVTLVVLAISEFFASYWYIWGSVVLSIPVLLSLPGKFQQAAVLKDKAILKLPFLGELAQCLAISQFSTTMEMLIKSGIPLAKALELCARQSGNSLITIASNNARAAVNEGRPMSEELSKHPIFTQTFITMAQTGEKSGQLDTTLKKVGDYYNMIVPRKIKAFFSFFEPAIILSLIVVVATVAVALVLPIMSIWEM